MKQEAMELALEALEMYQGKSSVQMFDAAITALREALAEPEQEPVANYCKECLTYNGHHEGCSHYTNPPQRTWVGLTNEEIDSYFEDHGYSPSEGYYPVIKDVEAKFKENNG